MSSGVQMRSIFKLLYILLTCCKYSLSGKTVSSHTGLNWLNSVWFGDPSKLCWNITQVSFKKFLPIIYNSRPPSAGEDVNDFLQISGTPGGWAEKIEIQT